MSDPPTEEELIETARLVAKHGGHIPTELVMNIDDARALGYEGPACQCGICGFGAEHFHWKGQQ